MSALTSVGSSTSPTRAASGAMSFDAFAAFASTAAADALDEPRRIALVNVGTRPLQIGGAERGPFLFVQTLSAILLLALPSWWTAALAALLSLAGTTALVRIGKADPHFRSVYLRQLHGADFYAPHGGLRAPPPYVPPRWRRS